MNPRSGIGPNRRQLMQGGAAAIAARAWGRGEPRLFAYAGSYTTAQRNARGDGIHVYRVNPATGAWTHVQHVGELVNPSFLAMRRDQRCLYSAHGDETYTTAFAVDRNSGRLTLLNRAETGGRNGVCVALDPAGRFLVVANYGSGNVSVLPVRPDGGLDALVQTVVLPGQPGPHRVEQASSHPHQVVFDPSGKFVLTPDKGLDRIFVFAFDAATGRLTPTAQGSAVARAGSGPRHAAFHPRRPTVWVVNELSNTIVTYDWDAASGHLRAVQILPALPSDFTGENTASGIAVSAGGRYVYCSNRGHDSIATFSVNASTGLLTAEGWTPSQGKTPRFIAMDPSHTLLVAANEQSDTVITWRADAASGKLAAVGQPVRNGSPVTVAFASWEG